MVTRRQRCLHIRLSISSLAQQYYGLLCLCLSLCILLPTPHIAFGGVEKGGGGVFSLKSRSRVRPIISTTDSRMGWGVPLITNDPVRHTMSLVVKYSQARFSVGFPAAAASVTTLTERSIVHSAVVHFCSCSMGETIVHYFKAAVGLRRPPDSALVQEASTGGLHSTCP